MSRSMRWRWLWVTGSALVLASCSTTPTSAPTTSRPPVPSTTTSTTTAPVPSQLVGSCHRATSCKNRVGAFPGLCRGAPKPEAVLLTVAGRWRGRFMRFMPDHSIGHYRLPRSSRDPATVAALFHLVCESMPRVIRANMPIGCPVGFNVVYTVRFFAADRSSVPVHATVTAKFVYDLNSCGRLSLYVGSHMDYGPCPTGCDAGPPALIRNLQERIAALAGVPRQNLFPYA